MWICAESWTWVPSLESYIFNPIRRRIAGIQPHTRHSKWRQGGTPRNGPSVKSKQRSSSGRKYLRTREQNRTSGNAPITCLYSEELDHIFASEITTDTKTYVVDRFPQSTRDRMFGTQKATVSNLGFMHALGSNQEEDSSEHPRNVWHNRFGHYTRMY